LLHISRTPTIHCAMRISFITRKVLTRSNGRVLSMSVWLVREHFERRHKQLYFDVENGNPAVLTFQITKHGFSVGESNIAHRPQLLHCSQSSLVNFRPYILGSTWSDPSIPTWDYWPRRHQLQTCQQNGEIDSRRQGGADSCSCNSAAAR